MATLYRPPSRLRVLIGRAVIGGLAAAGLIAAVLYIRDRTASCDLRLEVPDGFCAAVYADDVGPARHIAVAPDGAVYVATSRSPGIVALRDTNGDGTADERAQIGSEGGSGNAVADRRRELGMGYLGFG
jgi:hypothetical protein